MTTAGAPRFIAAFAGLIAMIDPSIGVAQPHVPLPAVNLGGSSFLDGAGGPGLFTRETVSAAWGTDLRTGDGAAVPGDYSLAAVVSLTQLAYTVPHEILGVHYGFGVVVPVGVVTTTIDGRTDTSGGLGDLVVSPLMLQLPSVRTRDVQLLHKFVADVFVPTGRYDRSTLTNLGRNAWSLNPFYAVTLIVRDRWEVSARLHYIWTSENHAPPAAYGDVASIQSGQAVHLNAASSYAFTPEVRVGVSGYFLRQVTPSRIGGSRTRGDEEQVAAIGPGVELSFGEFHLVANAYGEFAARSRFRSWTGGVTLKRAW